jgi:flavin reductase (DIM6/NTAB) family NADH-FMN oxidoreductase RutF
MGNRCTGLTGGVESHIVDDLSAFKLAFRRHAAGVAVVTGKTPEGTPVGFTATSLASLAAVPPLATFNMPRISTAWPAIEGAGPNSTEPNSTDPNRDDPNRDDPSGAAHVLIHLLGARNRALAERLAGPHAERFAGDHWAPGPLGLPLLKDVPAWMLGRVVARIPVADNAVVVVQIEDGGLGAEDDALLYHERSYQAPGGPLP